MLQNILVWQRNPAFGVNDTYMLSMALSYGLEMSYRTSLQKNWFHVNKAVNLTTVLSQTSYN